MRKALKALLAIGLGIAVIVAGCHKPDVPDEPNNDNQNDSVVSDSVVTFDHGFVDLGLPSGTLWATCNVGANNPEEFGDYFAWGETVAKDFYDWKSYRYGGIVNDRFAMTKYCSDPNSGFDGYVDTLTVLEPVDDVATVSWGTNWRVPTREEYEELYQKTAWIWTDVNGVEGRLLTGPNGNSVFFPATGFYLDGEVICPGLGIYWSSSLHTGFPERGWSLHFNFENCHVCGTYERNRGQVVRAVYVCQ